MHLELQSRSIARGLIALTLGFALFGFAAEWMHAQGHPVALGFANYFDPAQEGSLPEWFSASVATLTAGLLALIALAESERRLRWRWGLLALLMLAMSAAEATAIIDAPWPLLRMLPVPPGYSFDVMRLVIVAGGSLVLVLLAPLVRVVGRRRALAAFGCGLLVMGGQSGLGWLGGQLRLARGGADAAYLLAHVGEESCETLGMVLFLVLVLGWVESRGGLTLHARGAQAPSRSRS